ncbi:MAG: hypothetical protein ACE5D8_02645 [Fidelibacterota bacterium]
MKPSPLPSAQRIPLFLLAQTLTPSVKPWHPEHPLRSSFPVEDFLALLFQRKNSRIRTTTHHS